MQLSMQKKSLGNLESIEKKSAVGLKVIYDFINRLHAEHICYCHWKSNEHLTAAMDGDTDLDILVDRDKSSALRVILNEMGFKRFSGVPCRVYPGIEDYLSIDDDTGKLVHLHLHYQLTLGEKYLKGYCLPWTKIILSTRKFNEHQNIYVADPVYEMILFLIRLALKIRLRDRLKKKFRMPYLRSNDLKEFKWLKEKAQIESIAQISQELLGEEVANKILGIASGEITLENLYALKKSTKYIFRYYKSYGIIEGTARRWMREFISIFGFLNRHYLHRPFPSSRINPKGGFVVAFLGADGAGKSTVSKDIKSFLSKKIDVFPVYFGSGDGPSSSFRWPILQILRFIKKKNLFGAESIHTAIPTDTEVTRSLYNANKWRAWAKSLWAVMLFLEKRRKLRLTRRARNTGMLVICDRFPQCQVMGFNDGPLLSHWIEHPHKLLRWLAKLEITTYRQADKLSPDLVIKLDVSPEVAVQRKPSDSTMININRRIEAIRRLRYQPAVQVVVVNSDEAYQKVLLRVKQAIWATV